MTSRQVEANVKYRQKIFDQYVDHGASTKVAAQRAECAALKYASKQHRYRAETIVHTELAFAYNQGAHVGVLQAINAGFMGQCAMVSTAGTNRVCLCCRCTIEYREVEPPKPANNPAVDSLTAPPSRGNLSVLTLPPQVTSACKNFDELKLYWAESYNVKIADEVAALDFVSVSEAMQGIEAVLNEFPPAGFFLKEINVLSQSLMTNVRGRGIINFNPEYFSDRRKLLATLANGVKTRLYIKNATPFSAGAHEAGHTVEDWLTDKQNGELSLRTSARKIVRDAYQRAIQIAEGKDKTIVQLKEELSIHARNKNVSECLASAVADFLTNREQATLLSKVIWQILKEELD